MFFNDTCDHFRAFAVLSRRHVPVVVTQDVPNTFSLEQLNALFRLTVIANYNAKAKEIGHTF